VGSDCSNGPGEESSVLERVTVTASAVCRQLGVGALGWGWSPELGS
jgi:hypothetical protein